MATSLQKQECIWCLYAVALWNFMESFFQIDGTCLLFVDWLQGTNAVIRHMKLHRSVGEGWFFFECASLVLPKYQTLLVLESQSIRSWKGPRRFTESKGLLWGSNPWLWCSWHHALLLYKIKECVPYLQSSSVCPVTLKILICTGRRC